MKSIKGYNKFFETKLWTGHMHEYDIYDWFEDLKRYQWNKNQKGRVNEKTLKLWSNHFIGNGYFDKVSSLVDRMINSLKKADIEYVQDRMIDVYDNIPHNKEKSTSACISLGDYTDHDKPNKNKFNGALHTDLNDNTYIIVEILKAIIYPTLYIGSPQIPIRTTSDEKYVIEDIYQCDQFNIDNYNIKEGEVVTTPGEKRHTKISFYDIGRKKMYDVDKVIDMYKPSIIINIGGFSNAHTTGKMNLKKLESDIDEILPSVLSALDYEEVIFDSSRGDRKFDDNVDIYEYTLKILLKF